MALETLRRPTETNSKRLIIERSPREKPVWFDPRRDITDYDWQQMTDEVTYAIEESSDDFFDAMTFPAALALHYLSEFQKPFTLLNEFWERIDTMERNANRQLDPLGTLIFDARIAQLDPKKKRPCVLGTRVKNDILDFFDPDASIDGLGSFAAYAGSAEITAIDFMEGPFIHSGPPIDPVVAERTINTLQPKSQEFADWNIFVQDLAKLKLFFRDAHIKMCDSSKFWKHSARQIDLFRKAPFGIGYRILPEYAFSLTVLAAERIELVDTQYRFTFPEQKFEQDARPLPTERSF